jgi:hypothetical protein
LLGGEAGQRVVEQRSEVAFGDRPQQVRLPAGVQGAVAFAGGAGQARGVGLRPVFGPLALPVGHHHQQRPPLALRRGGDPFEQVDGSGVGPGELGVVDRPDRGDGGLVVAVLEQLVEVGDDALVQLADRQAVLKSAVLPTCTTPTSSGLP